MITGIARLLTLHLAVVLLITSTIISILVYLSPSIILAGKVALLVVSPGDLKAPAGSGRHVDGPSVFIGNLGSCSRSDNAGEIHCVPASLTAVYDLSVLPKNSPFLVQAATTTTAGFLLFSLCLTGLFTILFTLSCLQGKLGGKLDAMFNKPAVQRGTAWVGFLAFMIGLTAQLVTRMWFGNAVDNFNREIITNSGPQLIASTGNGFTMLWVAYAFFAVPLVASMVKLNAQGSKA